MGRGAEDQLALDPHLEFAGSLFELPRVQPAVGGQPQIDAVVLDQFLRRLWLRPISEIGRSPDHGHARVGSDAHGDHVLGHLLAISNAGVEALGDDIGQAVVIDDLDIYFRVGAQELHKLRKQDGAGGIFGGRDADGAGEFFPRRAQGGEFRLGVPRTRTHIAQQALARGRRRHASRGARQKAQLETRFQLLDGVAER